jgi:hypothetical protein
MVALTSVVGVISDITGTVRKLFPSPWFVPAHRAISIPFAADIIVAVSALLQRLADKLHIDNIGVRD